MRRVRIPLCLLLAAIAIAPVPVRAQRAAVQDIAIELRNHTGGKLKRFYAARNFAPLWTASGRVNPVANMLLEDLASADLDGLKPSRIDDLRDMIARSRSGDPRALADAERALSKAFTRYVSDVRRASKPQMVFADPALKPRKLAPETILTAAALARSLDDYVAGMGWMNPHYAQQRALLARAIASRAPPETIDRIRLNRDRARILPSAWTHHIVVDAASGRLWYYQAGRQEGTMRVVVGKPATPTPMLAGMMRYAILNPYWNVPVDLARTNVAPKILAGKTLASLRMEALSDWSANPQKLDPKSIDWHAVSSGTTELRLRQLPGIENSMGKVKFMFPNELGIYLHDTPEKALLKEDNRHFSNGCIRLEDAQRLGRWLFGGSIPASKSPETIAPLPYPVPVYVTYLTTAAGKDGSLQVTDVYGRDGMTEPRSVALR